MEKEKKNVRPVKIDKTEVRVPIIFDREWNNKIEILLNPVEVASLS